MLRRAVQPHALLDFTCSSETSAEHFQQCAEFPLLRNRGLGPPPLPRGQLEDFEAQQRLVTSVRFDVVTPWAEETRFEFRHSSGSPLVQELTRPSASTWSSSCPSERRAALLSGPVAMARGRARTSRPAPCGHGCSARAPLCVACRKLLAFCIGLPFSRARRNERTYAGGAAREFNGFE